MNPDNTEKQTRALFKAIPCWIKLLVCAWAISTIIASLAYAMIAWSIVTIVQYNFGR